MHLRARELEVAAAEVQLGPHGPRDVEREASDDENHANYFDEPLASSDPPSEWATDTKQALKIARARARRTQQPDSEEEDSEGFDGLAAEGGSGDELYDRAVAVICQHRKASTSFIQRHLQIGYNRAARIIERMEADGLVSEANHVGKREVLISGPEDVSAVS